MAEQQKATRHYFILGLCDVIAEHEIFKARNKSITLYLTFVLTIQYINSSRGFFAE